MEDEDNSTSSEETSSSTGYVEFILLLITEILSLICTLILFIYLIFHWKCLIKKALRNHIIFLLIVISLIYLIVDLPFSVNSYRLGHDQPRNLSFCLWWYWIDYSLIIISLFLAAIASFQRHLLIFHAHWLHSHRIQFLFHYFPIAIGIIYPALFYLSVIVFYPCNNAYNETVDDYCPQACYTDEFILFNFDWIFNTACPLLAILIGNIFLIIRVVRSMKIIRRRQRLIWKRQQKLTLQLLGLSSIFIFGWAPSTIISILQSLALPNLLNDIPQLNYLNFLTYFVCPLQSFLCLFGLPELIKSLKNKFKSKITPVKELQH